MRLTCPNCGAQYEVPDEVIPQEGRDVQCSNCGDTWFQAHPDYPEYDEEPELAAEPEPEPEPEAEPEVEPPEEPATEPAAPAAPAERSRKQLDSSLADILREEAEHEAKLRAAEAKTGLESQPDLGLDSGSDDEPARRAQQARDRMARLRGEEPKEEEQAADAGSRRGLLPDIEEINSTLRASGDAAAAAGGEVAAETARRRSGFTRGFGSVVIVAVLLVLIYANASKIAATVPVAKPALDGFVGLVDRGRIWLDGQLSALIPK